MDTKSRVRVISLTLFFSVFTVWAVFYIIISSYITDSAEKQAALAADHIIGQLGGEFAEAERLTYRLKQDAGVQALARERDRRGFFSLVGSLTAEVETQGSGFINSVVLLGADKHNYRLSGTLGNIACEVLNGAVSALDLPGHLSVELDGVKYIGYADEIIPDGAVVVLIEEEKILEVIRAYDQSGSLLVAISAGGETIVANTDRADLLNDPQRRALHSGLGVTPYEISVVADRSDMNASVMSFSVVAAITAVILAAMLFLYMRVLNRGFFRPMVSVIGSIKQLQTEAPAESLPHVGSAEFDDLVDKINEMLRHIEAKNAEVLVTGLRAKNAELGRQKALVFSLQKQINAHFTVNTMAAIRTAIAHGELDDADALMSGLMRIVRYAHAKEESINIWDESEILKYYVNIMSSRYGGKLTAEFDFDEELIDIKMPRMLLQPLIENAVEHGFKDMGSGCVIVIKAEHLGDKIRFNISDNGLGMSGPELAELKERLRAVPDSLDGLHNIALQNIRNRLYYYYGDRARLDINPSESGGIEVTIEMPTDFKTGGAA